MSTYRTQRMIKSLKMDSKLNETFENFQVLQTNADQFFLIIMGMCVFFVSGVAYWLIGFAFAYGNGGSAQAFIGAEFFASVNMPDTKYAEFFFQYTFAATAATIVSGAVAERCEFIAYFAYSFFITGFIYPVVTHWAWGGGWLSQGMTYYDVGQITYQDFAGSGIVHVLGGTAAFVGALLLGPRIGRFHKSQSGTIATIRGHSVPIAALGGFILFFGFLAFNGGSQLSISNAGDAAAVAISIVNTIIAGSFAAFGTLIINRLKFLGNSWSLLATINGALTGMVAACAGCNSMHPWGAAVLGIIASIVYTFYSWLMAKLKIDDPLDAVAVHFGGGSWGVIAIAFLDKTDGILIKGDLKSAYKLSWQMCGLVTIIGWSAVVSLLLFGLLKLFRVLRVPSDIEEKGLDIPKHNEPAYPVEAYGHGHIEKILQIMENHPTQVTQGFTNVCYEKEILDKGPYEHPEVKVTTSTVPNGKLKPQPITKPQSMSEPIRTPQSNTTSQSITKTQL
ncbi:hypothetical protein KUTeg_016436 [Tegillarca granosa]|uniref:Ammonium transporter AmtB-like domain-containing protein n=1 Tax=Tegillarca granosa TaxID=220873 RepID=A0ABQ9EPP8_TEGGR|nr:hypothetical protein KUTeg_016436 [Tegillarca granosa]